MISDNYSYIPAIHYNYSLNENPEYDFLILLRDFQLHEIALFFKSEICNPKSCLNTLFVQTLIIP